MSPNEQFVDLASEIIGKTFLTMMSTAPDTQSKTMNLNCFAGNTNAADTTVLNRYYALVALYT